MRDQLSMMERLIKLIDQFIQVKSRLEQCQDINYEHQRDLLERWNKLAELICVLPTFDLC